MPSMAILADYRTTISGGFRWAVKSLAMNLGCHITIERLGIPCGVPVESRMEEGCAWPANGYARYIRYPPTGSRNGVSLGISSAPKQKVEVEYPEVV